MRLLEMVDLKMFLSEQREHMLCRCALPIVQFNIKNAAQGVVRVQSLSQGDLGGWEK